jgi:hypothetical protein
VKEAGEVIDDAGGPRIAQGFGAGATVDADDRREAGS